MTQEVNIANMQMAAIFSLDLVVVFCIVTNWSLVELVVYRMVSQTDMVFVKADG